NRVEPRYERHDPATRRRYEPEPWNGRAADDHAEEDEAAEQEREARVVGPRSLDAVGDPDGREDEQHAPRVPLVAGEERVQQGEPVVVPLEPPDRAHLEVRDHDEGGDRGGDGTDEGDLGQ